MFWGRRPPVQVLLSLLLFVILLLPALLLGTIPVEFGPLRVAWADSRILWVYLWILLVTLLLVRLRDRRPIASVGLGLHPWTVRELLLGAILGLVMALVAILPLLLLPETRIVVSSAATGLLDDLLMIVLLAAGEELLLRGYLLQRLAELAGDTVAIILMAVAFVLLHLGNPGLTPLAGVNLLLAGLFFGLLWGATRSLWAPIGAHVGWNLLVGPMAGLPVSGIEMDQALLQITERAPVALSGGEFGPEGALPTILVLLGGILLVSLWGRFRTAPWAFARSFRGELARDRTKPFRQ